MDFVLIFLNSFLIGSLELSFIYITFGFFIYVFSLCRSTFFQILLLISVLVVAGVYLAKQGLDFFSGFLLVGELPLMLVSLLFFFRKNKLVFDSIYSFAKTNNRYVYFLTTLLILSCFYFLQPQTLINTTSFSTTLHSSLHVDHRNDFYSYYYIYYSLYPTLVILIGFLIFIVSYLVIASYYIQLSLKKRSIKSIQQFSFLRKQNFLKQASFSSKLSFFKKQDHSE